MEINATVLTSISGKTSGTVTATNAIVIKGSTAEVKAALVNDATKITATSSKPEISDNPSVADINLIVDECGDVTATMAAASVASFADLDTGASDLISITLNDAAFDANDPQTIAATALSAIGGKTAAIATVSNAVKIQGTVAQVKVALVDTDTLVVATPSLVNITGGDVALADITKLNNVAAKCDELTASLAAGAAAGPTATLLAIQDQCNYECGVDDSGHDFDFESDENTGRLVSEVDNVCMPDMTTQRVNTFWTNTALTELDESNG